MLTAARTPTRSMTPRLSPGSSAVLQRKCACGGSGSSGGGECEDCKKKKKTLQRQAADNAGPATAPPIVNEVLRSPGKPLDEATRSYMEPRFGHDFSKVRVHTDAKAAESARSVNALAYTVGDSVVFAAGRYAPQLPEGRRLLAHELTHLVQQRSTPAASEGNLAVGPEGSTSENEAESAASLIASGGARTIGSPTSTGAALARQADPAQAPASKPALAAPGLGAVSPIFDGPLQFNDFDLSSGPAIQIWSPVFSLNGGAILDANKAPNGMFEMGFMQAVVVSQMKAVYSGAAGTPPRSMKVGCSPVPVRDSEKGVAPWMRKDAVITFSDQNSAVSVQDHPHNLAPWQTSDKKANLTQTSGDDTLCTWLMLREKATNNLIPLNWVIWNIDWGASYDFATRKRTSTGNGGKLVGDGEGQGPHTPIPGGPTANTTAEVTWDPPQ